MPSLNQNADNARVLVEEAKAAAGLAATISANRQFLKYLSREPAPTADEIRTWVESNLVLLLWRAEEFTP